MPTAMIWSLYIVLGHPGITLCPISMNNCCMSIINKMEGWVLSSQVPGPGGCSWHDLSQSESLSCLSLQNCYWKGIDLSVNLTVCPSVRTQIPFPVLRFSFLLSTYTERILAEKKPFSLGSSVLELQANSHYQIVYQDWVTLPTWTTWTMSCHKPVCSELWQGRRMLAMWFHKIVPQLCTCS